MRDLFSKWVPHAILLIMYKILLDFIFLRVYYSVYGYLAEGSYQWNTTKFTVSLFVFLLLLSFDFVAMAKDNISSIQSVVITLCMIVCVVPMLSVYAFLSYVDAISIVYPAVFWFILMVGVSNRKWNSAYGKVIKIPSIKQASSGILIICSFAGLICWAWAGFPLLLSLSDSTAQRLALRANAMPTVLGYVFVLLGGVIFPYLFARYLDSMKIVYAVVSFGVGFLLYSVNGMKTWIFLYAFVLAIYLLCKWLKENVCSICNGLVVIICILLLLCIEAYVRFGVVDFLGQFGRIFCIPNGIGFRSINFFSQVENPYLYLRESILRHFFATPYPGGSDFYMKYGTNTSIASGRSNNGLWGDAFRNFGLIGIIMYPIIISKVLSIVACAVKNKHFKFQIVVLFLMIWNAVNVSLFTWLISGGVIVTIIINAFFHNEDLYEINKKIS